MCAAHIPWNLAASQSFGLCVDDVTFFFSAEEDCGKQSPSAPADLLSHCYSVQRVCVCVILLVYTVYLLLLVIFAVNVIGDTCCTCCCSLVFSPFQSVCLGLPADGDCRRLELGPL